MNDGTAIPVIVLAVLAGALLVSVAWEVLHDVTVARRRREQAAVNRRIKREIERQMP